jgi:hypothetical protein
MKRIRGIARAVVTIAGAISLSSPLLVSPAGGVHHREQPPQKDQKDQYGVTNPGRMVSVHATADSSLREETITADIKSKSR